MHAIGHFWTASAETDPATWLAAITLGPHRSCAYVDMCILWSWIQIHPKQWGLILAHTYIHTYIRTYVRTYIHTYLRTYVRTYLPTYVRTYIHTYIHTYVHTYIRTEGRTDRHTYPTAYLCCWGWFLPSAYQLITHTISALGRGCIS